MKHIIDYIKDQKAMITNSNDPVQKDGSAGHYNYLKCKMKIKQTVRS